MDVCIICGGSGFILHDGLCDVCNGTGESDFDYGDVIFEDITEHIHLNEPLEPKILRYHEYYPNPRQDIEQKQYTSAR